MDRLLERCRQYFSTEDLYKVLKTHPKSTAKEVRKAYIELSLKYHPDKVSENEKKFATEKFKVINQVYSIINDEEKRKSYDAAVASGQLRKQSSSWQSRARPTFQSANTSRVPFNNLHLAFSQFLENQKAETSNMDETLDNADDTDDITIEALIERRLRKKEKFASFLASLSKNLENPDADPEMY
ncbi:DnaJ domain,Ferritin-related [Cinara cedri]|uniref:DnaJ domain,Ferritin-related n=1 Tax=Cinara cedri TaxID=506608 RepID=A0A5E4N909_9HEMI|nr:DnaJ domain,Ferritin-related [Cinara cedri]